MPTKTTIRYSLSNRGRTYNGQSRDGVLDLKKLVAYINGGSCQERVKSRDMVGYYGHATRAKLGLYPTEGIASGTSPVPDVIPAIVTTDLKAWSDGTIEHTTEFLDTEPGEIAAKLFASKVGGFSSAIHPSSMAFAGFDYVLSPNYNTNRGYLLDSVQMPTNGMCDSFLILDDARPALQDLEVMALMDEVNGLKILNRSMASAVLDSERLIDALQVDNESLTSRLHRETQLSYQDSTAAFLRDLKAFADVNTSAIFDSANATKKPQNKESDRAFKNLISRTLRR